MINYTLTVTRGYMQSVQSIFHAVLFSVCGPYNFVWKNPPFPRQILFTDECKFTRDTVLNSRNSHVWDDENPHPLHAHGFQQRFVIDVWAGIVGGR